MFFVVIFASKILRRHKCIPYQAITHFSCEICSDGTYVRSCEKSLEDLWKTVYLHNIPHSYFWWDITAYFFGFYYFCDYFAGTMIVVLVAVFPHSAIISLFLSFRPTNRTTDKCEPYSLSDPADAIPCYTISFLTAPGPSPSARRPGCACDGGGHSNEGSDCHWMMTVPRPRNSDN